MILTQCAVCATELGLSLGKKCGRCSTRYCGAECQVQHWKEGGHDNLCKKIKKAGGAEQYNANTKYAEAVAVAVEKCAEDAKGQTCYQGYREHLRTAVEGLIALSMRSVRVRGETHEVYQKACATLRSALDTQLDWSLDDLELSPSEKLSIDFFSEHRLHRL